MKINILKEGDSVLSITEKFIAVQRKNGEVDMVPLYMDENSGLRIDESKIVTIGYGDNTVSAKIGNLNVINYK